MKKTAITILTAAIALGASARTAQGLKIYINPGHGGHDAANDRNVVIAPYSAGDPEGYWESNSNLSKGLQLRDMLLAKGYQVVMSRTTNTDDDDLALSTIVRLSNESNADLFFSIHSNATGTVNRRNQPLMLYRGWDDDPYKPQDKVVAGILNKYLLQNQATVWTGTSLNLRGDWSFYPQWNKSGLGVLRGNNIIGLLSEGSFHDYIPEAYRLINDDFCWLEAWHFRKAIDEYLGVDGETVGAVTGRLNDIRLPRDGQYIKFGEDKLATVQGAKVELVNAAGTVIDTYTTETKHLNGFYLFKNVEPGTYTVRAAADSYYPMEETVTVAADEISYCNLKMNRVRSTPPVVEGYSPEWSAGTEPVACNTPVSIHFSWDMDTESTERAFSITPAMEGTFEWSDLNYCMTWTPTGPYQTNTEYTVTLSTDARHAGGMALEQPLTFKFMTSAKNYMNIVGYFPKQDEEVHYQNGSIEFRFDNKPQTNQLFTQMTCTDADGNAVPFARRQLKSSSSKDAYGFFRVPFSGDLTVGKTYHLKLAAEFADKEGLTIPEAVDITFTAVDASKATGGSTVLDPFSDNTLYAYDADGSVNVTKAAVAKSTANKLFDAAVKYSYTFGADEGSEARYGRSAATETVVSPGQTISINVCGDLTGNEVYLEMTSDLSTKYVQVCVMDFLGWRHFDVPTTELESVSTLTGVKVVQIPSQISHSGEFMLERATVGQGSGIDDVAVAQAITVHPNPASEYIVANAACLVTGLKLVSMSGTEVAATHGNVLNVADVAAGNYLLIVNTATSQTAHHVVIKH